MKIELKPCPFCGSIPYFIHREPGEAPCVVLYNTCGVATSQEENEAAAAEVWNNRMPLSTPDIQGTPAGSHTAVRFDNVYAVPWKDGHIFIVAQDAKEAKLASYAQDIYKRLCNLHGSLRTRTNILTVQGEPGADWVIQEINETEKLLRKMWGGWN